LTFAAAECSCNPRTLETPDAAIILANASLNRQVYECSLTENVPVLKTLTRMYLRASRPCRLSAVLYQRPAVPGNAQYDVYRQAFLSPRLRA